MSLWVSIIPAVAILIVQIVWDKFRERSKKPIYYYRTEEIISMTDKLADDIVIHFKEHKVAQVSITRVGLVNVGKDPIDQTDIKNVDHELRMTFDNDIHILREPKILKKSRKELDFQAVVRDRDVLLSFKLLDYRDGAVVEVVHTGNKDTKVEIKGLVIGVPKGIIERSYQYASKRVRRYHYVSGLISAALLIFVIYKMAPAFVFDISQHNISWPALFVTLLLTIGLVLSIIGHIGQFLKSIPTALSLDI